MYRRNPSRFDTIQQPCDTAAIKRKATDVIGDGLDISRMTPRTKSIDPVYLFFDTNILLHFTMFDEVNWCTVLDTKAVCLIVAPIIHHELSDHKDDASNERRQKRARDVIRKLDKFLPDTAGHEAPVRKGVTIRELPLHPHVGWNNLGLLPQQGDDRLIASILEFKDQNPTADVRLISNDGPLRRRARHFGIQAVDPDGKVQPLPLTATAAELEVAKLKEVIREQQLRAPSLTFGFFGQTDIETTLELPIPALRPGAPTDQQIADELAQEWTRHEKILSCAPEGASLDAIQEYSSAAHVYMQQLEAAKRLQRSLEFGPRCDIIFALKNSGGASAQDVQLVIEFPADAFVVGSKDKDSDLWGEVILPNQPVAYWMRQPNPFPIDYGFLAAAVPQPPYRPPQRAGPLYDRDFGRHRIWFKDPKMVQDHVWQMPLVFAYLPPEIASKQGYEITYQLRADHLPTVEQGRLHIVWKHA